MKKLVLLLCIVMMLSSCATMGLKNTIEPMCNGEWFYSAIILAEDGGTFSVSGILSIDNQESEDSIYDITQAYLRSKYPTIKMKNVILKSLNRLEK